MERNKFLLVGDFNVQEHERGVKSFLYKHDLNNLGKENTWFKSVDNPSCIYLSITSSPRRFTNTASLNVGNSDFHKMVVTVLNKISEIQTKGGLL